MTEQPAQEPKRFLIDGKWQTIEEYHAERDRWMPAPRKAPTLVRGVAID